MTALSRAQMAAVVAGYLPRNSFVNLGIGAPTQVADFMRPDQGVILHSENGILNMGPRPPEGEEDLDLINAGKSPITIAPGGSYFDTALSFSMMRGGHLDIAILGAYQVSGEGDLANWTTGEVGTAAPAVGGAIDLAVGSKAIWVMMDHTTKDGAPRIVRQCSYPLTAAKVVKRIFTNLAIIDVDESGLVVTGIVKGNTIENVQERTGVPLNRASHVREILPPD
jgi:3-oxoadipate CoA-transferase beta subunit